MPTPAELRARLGELSALDRGRFRRRIGGASRIGDSAKRENVLDRLDTEITDAAARYTFRQAAAPKKLAYPEDLPIIAHREELLATIRDHQVVIVSGETGSGKSTQLPKMCLELGRGVEGLIAHTQPRRLAARTIAQRIADEIGTTLGGSVGYAVRFADHVGDATLLKLMTDGLLLAEIQRDRMLSRYDTIIVDEAHERSLNVDFLIGYLHQLLPDRPDLKVIITSATIDTERFSEHFGDVPVVEVSGRAYPVEVRYRPLDDPSAADVKDQPNGIADAVVELFTEGDGDILVFCSGEREIRDATDALTDLELRHTQILPLYARLPAAEQQRVFQSGGGRRVVVATNVAETSLTVPGVRFVVDAGTARISRYSRRTKVQRLPIEPISRASADQRAGRCGRLGPGVCIRLYAEDDFEARPEFTEPEIQRTSLASVILQMAAIGLGEISSFPFLDPPDLRSIKDGVSLLEELGAIDPQSQGSDQWLTKPGRQIARLPLDPRIGRMVIEADANFCLTEVLVITSALSIQDPRERPAGREEQAATSHARFAVEGSDLLGWPALWDYLRRERKTRTGNQFRKMCREEFLNYVRIREWMGVHSQLSQGADELGLRRNSKPADPDSIHRTLLAGLLSHVGQRDPNSFEYRGARGARFAIQPGSVLFKKAPEWVMASELVETSRLWARGLVAIEPEWVESAGPHLIRRTYSDPWWDEDRGSAVASETVSLYGLAIVSGRTVQYGRVAPAEARELFIRNALIDGEWDSYHEFVAFNRAQFAEVREREARGRLGDLLVDDEFLVAFFAERIPDDIVSVRHFDAWWNGQRGLTPDLLNLSLDDLIDPEAGEVDDEAFPEFWHIGDLALPLTYEFDPSSPTDGVTVHVPVGALDRLDPSMFEWQVPGLRNELVTALVRSLPKDMRKVFVPIPDTVSSVAPHLDPSTGGLIEVLRRQLAQIGGSPILPTAFAMDDVPSHLKPHFMVIDQKGQTISSGRDLESLRRGLRDQTRSAVAETPHPLERAGITEWDFGELPESVEIEGVGAAMTAYPALVDEGGSVAIRLLATPTAQAAAMWDANRRLLLLSLSAPRRLMKPMVTNETKLALVASPYESVADWEDDCLTAALDDVLASAGGPARDAVAFDGLVERARTELHERLGTIASESLEALRRRHSAMASVERLKASAFEAAVADITDQLGRLVYRGFVSGLGAGRMADVQRYIAAAERRAQRLKEDPGRDAIVLAGVAMLEAEHDHLIDVLGWTPELVEVAWMLQEYRVSVFAQSLGVKGTVSEKRIRSALTAAAG